MRPFTRLFGFPFRSRAQVALDVDDELAFHLDMRAAELVGGGLSDDAARAEVARRFGDVEVTRSYCASIDRAGETRRRRGATAVDPIAALRAE
ncbi:MAG: permease prefix domain 1-containing protein [Gemmatimonadaceae bacterium]